MYKIKIDIVIVKCMKKNNIIFPQQSSRFMINLSYGYILRHVETNEYSYFYPSQENRVLEVGKYVLYWCGNYPN